ncbi:hypothetical protein E2C01_096926 [Portunus trituberculatus]|uniref:Uncharacterized protein n=1 Tax=Portunus trituberculatus TaxID=210409 RepID=A0A5B7JWX6_PORTR|nr:hypothetical protein [Portunus trituberculatus]
MDTDEHKTEKLESAMNKQRHHDGRLMTSDPACLNLTPDQQPHAPTKPSNGIDLSSRRQKERETQPSWN